MTTKLQAEVSERALLCLAILAFLEERVRLAHKTPARVLFTLNDLNAYVAWYGLAFAPDSPRRTLSDLRARGFVSYELLDRRDWTYRFLPGSQEPRATRMRAATQADLARLAATATREIARARVGGATQFRSAARLAALMSNKQP